VCIGNQFAMMEAQLVLATILQRYSLSLIPNQSIQLNPLVTLRPEPDIQMQILEREIGAVIPHPAKARMLHEGQAH
jgi:hypothetical protein